MADNPTGTAALIAEYIGRGRASLSNVASHFGLTRDAARQHLRGLEADGSIRRLGAALLWETNASSECPMCGGSGGWPGPGGWGKCQPCGGTGSLPAVVPIGPDA